MRISNSLVFYICFVLIITVLLQPEAFAAEARVTIGQTINGSFNTTSNESSDFGRYDQYRLDLKAGQIARILVVCQDFRLHCSVDFGKKTGIVGMGEGDLSDYGKVGKFTMGQVIAEAAGPYVITVYTGRKDTTCSYTISFTELAFGGGSIEVGKKAKGTFTENTAATERGSATDTYSLVLRAHQTVTISAEYGYAASGGQELMVVISGKHYSGEMGAVDRTKSITVGAGDRDVTARIDVGTGNDLGLPVNAGVTRPYTLTVSVAAKNAKLAHADEDAHHDDGWGN